MGNTSLAWLAVHAGTKQAKDLAALIGQERRPLTIRFGAPTPKPGRSKAVAPAPTAAAAVHAAAAASMHLTAQAQTAAAATAALATATSLPPTKPPPKPVPSRIPNATTVVAPAAYIASSGRQSAAARAASAAASLVSTAAPSLAAHAHAPEAEGLAQSPPAAVPAAENQTLVFGPGPLGFAFDWSPEQGKFCVKAVAPRGQAGRQFLAKGMCLVRVGSRSLSGIKVKATAGGWRTEWQMEAVAAIMKEQPRPLSIVFVDAGGTYSPPTPKPTPSPTPPTAAPTPAPTTSPTPSLAARKAAREAQEDDELAADRAKGEAAAAGASGAAALATAAARIFGSERQQLLLQEQRKQAEEQKEAVPAATTLTFAAGPLGFAFDWQEQWGKCCVTGVAPQGQAAGLGLSVGMCLVQVGARSLRNVHSRSQMQEVAGMVAEQPRPLTISFLAGRWATVTEPPAAEPPGPDFKSTHVRVEGKEFGPGPLGFEFEFDYKARQYFVTSVAAHGQAAGVGVRAGMCIRSFGHFGYPTPLSTLAARGLPGGNELGAAYALLARMQSKPPFEIRFSVSRRGAAFAAATKTKAPTPQPTPQPTPSPTTAAPTPSPSPQPTPSPSRSPTSVPPTPVPTPAPTDFVDLRHGGHLQDSLTWHVPVGQSAAPTVTPTASPTPTALEAQLLAHAELRRTQQQHAAKDAAAARASDIAAGAAAAVTAESHREKANKKHGHRHGHHGRHHGEGHHHRRHQHPKKGGDDTAEPP